MQSDDLWRTLLDRNRAPFYLIAGPCVIESEDHSLRMAESISNIAAQWDIPLIFKSSFDKANRTSIESFRGPGLEEGLAVLERVRKVIDVPVLTDIHESWQAQPVAEVVDVLQIPAYLCRQTDLLVAAGRTGKIINIKKGQFMAPHAMVQAREKIISTGNPKVMLTERGSFFGYHELVVDFRALVWMRQTGSPVVYDATHSIQRPFNRIKESGGDRDLVPPLARAAAAARVDGFFMEVHDNPDRALSDRATQWPLDKLPDLLSQLVEIALLATRQAQRMEL